MKRFRPSLRLLLLLAFSIVAILPVGTLGQWVLSHAHDRVYNTVKEKHLLVAKNITLALSKYTDDISSMLSSLSKDPTHYSKSILFPLLKSQYIHDLWYIKHGDMNHIIPIYPSTDTQKTFDVHLTKKQISDIRKYAATDGIHFLPISFDSEKNPAILVVQNSKENGTLVIAEVYPDYIKQIQSQIQFGKRGHAAIVDHTGTILAHPKKSWMAELKNISGLSIVKHMMKGETGVDEFYSPAKKADMIAGFSVVPHAGWGVMVPQPISELNSKISEIKLQIIGITLLGLLLAIIIGYFLASRLTKPIRQLVAQVQDFATNHTIMKTNTISMHTKELQVLNETFGDMSEQLYQKTQSLRYNAYHDHLTKLPNRYRLQEFINERLEEKKEFTLMLLDLDKFKDINDHWSHIHGDKLLKMVAEDLKTITGKGNLVARIGGDEFSIIIAHQVHKEEIDTITASILNIFKTGYTVFNETLYVGGSLGLAFYPKDGDTISELMQSADLAMHEAKKRVGSNSVCYHASMSATLHKRMEISQALYEAIEKKQFSVHYQPKVNCITYKIVGLEALVRWQHPTLGLLDPGTFIPIAENSGEMVRLGKLIMDQVFQDISEWKNNGMPSCSVSVNLSPQQLEDSTLLHYLRSQLSRHEMAAHEIEFEIIESLFASKKDIIQTTLRDIQNEGFLISIDDFGTGESSLGRLKEYDIKTIKIDQIFIYDLATNPKSVQLLRSIIHMSYTLGIDIVIEGIETKEQLSVLQNIYEGTVQGFLFSKAVDSKTIMKLMGNHILPPSKNLKSKT